MKQYFLCPKCKKRLVKYGPEQYACTKCKSLYGVRKSQQYTMRFLNFIIILAGVIGLLVGLGNIR